MREEEKKPNPWNMTDPKPPVVQSGHVADRNKTVSETGSTGLQ